MTDYTKGFERWWKTYPTHRRREKIKCFEVWQKRSLEDRTDEIVAKLAADVSFDPAWQPDNRGKQFIPLSKTYLNGGRYDDDKPKPRRAMPEVRADDPEEYVEEDKFLRATKKVGANWLMRRVGRGGIPEDKVEKSLQLLKSLAEDARDLHAEGRLTHGFAQTIRDELDALVAR